MITEEDIKKYASSVLLETVDILFDNNKEQIDTFYKDFIKKYKRNSKLKKNIKDNEVVDQLIIDELEKSFTQRDIGRVLNHQMVLANDVAISELSTVLDEKFKPIEHDLRIIFKDEKKYDQFKKLVTENLVVSNLNLNSSVVKALKNLNMTGAQTAQIMQLVSLVDN